MYILWAWTGPGGANVTVEDTMMVVFEYGGYCVHYLYVLALTEWITA